MTEHTNRKATILTMAVVAIFTLTLGAAGGYLAARADIDPCIDAVEAHQEYTELVGKGATLASAPEADVEAMADNLDDLRALDAIHEERYGTSSLRTLARRCTG